MDRVVVVDEQEKQDKYKRWKDTTSVMLGTINQESYFKARSVSVVADELRKWNEDAYKPEVISIGPRYTGRKELLPMEVIKWRFMFHLFNRSLGYTVSPEKYVKNCMDAILNIDAAVRSSYVSEIELDSYDLAAIMFNDGCFLLEFLISGSSIDSIIPPFGGRFSAIGPNPVLEIKKEVVMRDLTLLENQIPLFVLDVLFQNIFDKGFHYLIHEIHNQAMSLFRFDEANTKAKAEAMAKAAEAKAKAEAEAKAKAEAEAKGADSVAKPKAEAEAEAQAKAEAEAKGADSEAKPKAKARANFKFAHFLELASQNINKEWEGLHEGESKGESKVESKGESKVICGQIESQCQNSCFWKYGYKCCAKIETKHTLNRCATKLKAFGVRINPLPSTLEFGMKFSNTDGKLEIPQVRVTGEMKAKWLNLIAWEHHKKWIKPKGSYTNNENQHWRVATSSALLFNDLICCSSDVQLLKDRGVLVLDEDLKMNNRDLMTVFHSMEKGVDRGIIDPIYSSNFDALNNYSAPNYTTRIPILLWHYISRFQNLLYTFWKFLRHGYNFAATAVTLLTVIQTFYAVFAYHRPPH